MDYNIVYIHTHDSGRYFQPYGYAVDTPNINRFALNSHIFTKAFSVAPTCSPSRTSLFTSLYPHETGKIGLTNRGFHMESYDQHFVRRLNDEGYLTLLAGIQHEAAHYHESVKGGNLIGYQKNLTTETNLKEIDNKLQWDVENTEKVVDWIGNYSDTQPFFLSHGFFGTHRPFPLSELEEGDASFHGVPDGFPNNHVTRKDFYEYNMSVKTIDKCFGDIYQALKEKDLLDKTIILFTTDHGLALPFGKSSLYDAGLGVAFMLSIPEVTGSKMHDALVSHLDVVPTLCDYLQIDIPEYVRGKSLRPLLESQEEIHEELYFEMNFHTSYEPARAIRTKRFKYIEFLELPESIQLSNINDSIVKDYYLKHELSSKEKKLQQMFDLVYDPDEKNNIINDPTYEEEKVMLQNKLAEWRKETNDHLDPGTFEWQDSWIVNKKSSISQKGSSKDDYVEGHEPYKFRD